MKKKILFFGIKTFPSKGGTDRVAENLLRRLQHDFDLTLFCLKDENWSEHPTNVQIIRFDPILKGGFGSLIYFLRSTIKALSMDVDLIHVHKTECAFFIPFLMLRHKVMATSHEAPYRRDKWNFLEKTYFRLAEPIFMYWPNLVTCISEPLTNTYKKRYHREVLYLPNGINILTSKFYDFESAQSALKGRASLEKPFILFGARRLMATKGCHTFLKAMRNISYQGQIFVAGEINDHTAYIDELFNLARGLDVHFIGFIHPIETMLALLSKCQLFIFPSETEGMSIMLLEAASTGVPIIASDIPENKIFKERELLFFKNKSVEDLAEKISYALKNPDEMRIRGERTQQAAADRYSWEWIAQEYKELYLQLSAPKAVRFQ